MGWQNKPASTTQPQCSPTAELPGNGAKYVSLDHEIVVRTPIDFHSPEFNRTDDLNDYGGNYRDFETLEGVVTSHERHQQGISRARETCEAASRSAPLLKPGWTSAVAGTGGESSDAVTIISEGRTLIIDTDAKRATAIGRVLNEQRLSCTVLITGDSPEASAVGEYFRPGPHRVDSASVTGAFGAFSASVTREGRERGIAESIGAPSAFDLVLDLQPSSSFGGGRLPMGYYAPGTDPSALQSTLAELPEMRGQFQKPRFVSVDGTRCLHGRRSATPCNLCAEICPVGAIRGTVGMVSVNPYLCQGCAGCALACPVDALRMIRPSREDMAEALWTVLTAGDKNAASRAPAKLVISDVGRVMDRALAAGDDTTVFFEVEQIAHVRLELLLAALAFGVHDIVVVCAPENPLNVMRAVEQQVEMARAVLRGLDLEQERARFLVAPSGYIDVITANPLPIGPEGESDTSAADAATLPPSSGGRMLAYLAGRYLRDQSGIQRTRLPLPEGSSFGLVTVEPAACTLCMACTAACPTGALCADGDRPRLLFREFLCHQCGLCRETCPEGAIRLVPSLLPDPEKAEQQTALREAEPFRCVECGVPFASPAIIEHIKEKLSGHRMFATDRQMRRLEMCATCRARDALAARDMDLWNR
jgi:ferredoxin